GVTFQLHDSYAMGAPVVDDGSASIGTALDPALINGTGAGGGHAGGTQYRYRYSFVDNAGNESVPSAAQTITVPGSPGDGNEYSVILDGIPTDASYAQVRIYRTQPGGNDFFELDTLTMAQAADPYIDANTTPLDLGNQLD